MATKAEEERLLASQAEARKKLAAQWKAEKAAAAAKKQKEKAEKAAAAKKKKAEKEAAVKKKKVEKEAAVKKKKVEKEAAGKKRANTWHERLGELQVYKQKHGECNVPQKYSPNKKLGAWVNEQRNQKNHLDDGKRSAMTEKRIELLEQLGFVWAKRKLAIDTSL